jgi:PadR family transcriptional regulator, regulatory protein PadR
MAITGRPSGTVYPILLDLEQQGLLQSAWELRTPQELGRPQRRYYWLTSSGAIAARESVYAAAAMFSTRQSQ